MPLDCSPEDTANYLSVLTGDDAEWAALSAEIQAIADGATVEKIDGDQKTTSGLLLPAPVPRAVRPRGGLRVRRGRVARGGLMDPQTTGGERSSRERRDRSRSRGRSSRRRRRGRSRSRSHDRRRRRSRDSRSRSRRQQP